VSNYLYHPAHVIGHHASREFAFGRLPPQDEPHAIRIAELPSIAREPSRAQQTAYTVLFSTVPPS